MNPDHTHILIRFEQLLSYAACKGEDVAEILVWAVLRLHD